MPQIFRANTDISTGHCYGPKPCLIGSPDVFVNNKPVVRIGDNYSQTHTCGNDTHVMGVAATGSSTVLVNNKGVHRTGDLVQCGDIAGIGSPDVFAN
jgi:uncharacterized Zn-binding protein involved in type VI secretion